VCIDTVWADATRLRQVLLNLVSNAVKYNRAGGRVELVLGAHGGDASLLRLQVIDTGRGMDAQQLAHLFEPFNRMGMESSGIPGTGIGLLISRRLVELMGGAIEVSSRAGEGSNFTLVLPLAVPAPDVAAPPPARVPRRDERVRGRVLYIEDNPVNAVLVEGYLALRPHVMLQIAVDGAKGLASAQADPPDVVLLDLNLPDIDGFEVVRRLRAHPATAHVPCVAVTASALAAERDRALAGGFNAFWTKPLSAADFLAALDRLLGGPVR
jgi:CheY-like chemotaxis protein